MEERIRGYFRQTLYTFNKLAELSFSQEKPYNSSLIAEIRTILSTIKYNEKLKNQIITVIFQIGILLKRSRFFTSKHIDQQLIEKVQMLTRKRDMRKRSPNPTQTFTNIFKRRNSAVSEASNLSLPLEVDASMKKSKSQYQTLTIRKLSFEASDLSKHPIKNLQTTINILSDKGNKEEENADDSPEQTTQNIFSSSRSFLNNPDKRKGKDTGRGRRNHQTNKKISSRSEGGRDSSHSSDEEPDRRDTWHLKL